MAACWNEGLARLRLGDRAAAAPLLRTGLEMARHVPRGAWGAAGAGADAKRMGRLVAEVEAAAVGLGA